MKKRDYSKPMYERLIKFTRMTRKSFAPPYRDGHLTASKIPAFTVLSDYDTAVEMASQVFFGKQGKPKNDFMKKALDHGNFFEKVANSRLRAGLIPQPRYGFDHEDNDGQWSVTGTYRQIGTKKTFMFSGTPDMMLMRDDGAIVPVEIKCPFRLYTLGLPLEESAFKPIHWIQLVIQAILLGSDEGYLFMFVPGTQAKPDQYLLWRVDVTPEAIQFLLDLVFETYTKIKQCGEMGDCRKVFTMKGGVKAQNDAFIKDQMTHHTTLLNKQLLD